MINKNLTWATAPETLKVSEAAILVGLHINTIRSAIHDNRLLAAKPTGSHWRIQKIDLMDFCAMLPCVKRKYLLQEKLIRKEYMMHIMEIEDLESMEQCLSVYGKPVTFSVYIEDHIPNASAVTKRIYIGNKKIGFIVSGDGNWNVLEKQGQHKVPFVMPIDAIIYILKEEGYL